MSVGDPIGGSIGLSLVLISYFLFSSGIVYDFTVKPPATGKVADEYGNIKPQVFMTGKVNGQFIYEGLAAALLFLVGAAGFLALDRAGDKDRILRPFVRQALLYGGGTAIVTALFSLEMFMRFKLPSFGKW